MVLVTVTPLTQWWARALSGPWYERGGDVLVVLTGSTSSDLIGLDSYWRAVYTVRSFRKEHWDEILISGTGPGVPAAEIMRDFIVAHGVPKELVRVETGSKRTRDSAVNVAALAAADPGRYRGRKLVLLTSDFHMYRSFRAFERAGLKVDPRPIPDLLKRYESPWERWSVFQELVKETVKIGYYWARGWL
jgi:uncharacterized SAM-binding protein YcdF (DUF218 family)